MYRILLIEDEADTAKVLIKRLSSEGFDVIVAVDGMEGLKKARTENPDLIILDLMLPKIDGYKICAMLKRDVRYTKIPVIIFTARAEDTDKKMAEECGATAYITKPFDAQVLLLKIHELLESRKAAND